MTDKKIVHKLLARQIKKHLGEEFLNNPSVEHFLSIIADTYHQYEEDRDVLERTMELSSTELTESFQKLREQQTQLEEAYEELNATRNQLEVSEKIAILSQELMRIHEQLTAAQQHAKMIQSAILGSKEEIVKHFKNAFILYAPKDIVSGDFYWFSHHDNYKIIIAGDCTGHGVPAAFMTIMGFNILNEIVNRELIFAPDQILYYLDKMVLKTFQRKGAKFEITDGMDMAILVFDETEQSVAFSGARNPLIFIRDNHMEVIKSARFPIGDDRYGNKTFNLHTIHYQAGDRFYIYTDGYQDQFGGANNKKLMSKKFQEILFSIHLQTMFMQKDLLVDFMKDWLRENEQIDDIMVIGIST